jgi:hypothetical protein
MITCRPHYHPREFSSILFVSVYLPPQTDAGTKTTLNQCNKAISKQEHAHPEAALLLAWHFNAGNLKSFFTTFLPERHRDTYKALPRPPFGKSDHYSILQISAYKTKLMQEVVTRSMRKWSDDVDATLQDCFASTEWNMFRDSSNGTEEFTTSVIIFINKCIDEVVPTVTVHIPPEAMDYRLHPHRDKGYSCRFQGAGH